ncbi:MAG: hypothetical protein JO126_01095 [Alphaproteobacteria bacterium]|nr:hypothetical protein [Alphaproteobacteria bacterium]MBV8548036.1 hypothetical protein [Alphaproteobacteria bacterium]
MTRISNLLLLTGLMLVAASTAHAEPIPADVLKHDYDNCMGGANAAPDPDRAKFCACIKEQMSRWDLETYTNIALEQMKSGDTMHPPPKVQEVANYCIGKVIH